MIKHIIRVMLLAVAGLAGLLSMVFLGGFMGWTDPIWHGGYGWLLVIFGIPSIVLGSYPTYRISRYLLYKMAGDTSHQEREFVKFMGVGFIAGCFFWPAALIPSALGLFYLNHSSGETLIISTLAILVSGVFLSAFISSMIIGAILRFAGK